MLPPLLHENKFIIDFRRKAEIFNTFFAKQCFVINTGSDLPTTLTKKTHKSLSTVCFTSDDILNLLETFTDFLNSRKQRVALIGQFSSSTSIEAGVLQGSILGPLLFLIYISNLSNDLKTNVKLFADDTSLFSVVHYVNTSANNLNNDLSKINNWATQWKMSFNPNPSKEAQKVKYFPENVRT